MSSIVEDVVLWLEDLGIDAYYDVPSVRPDSFAVVDLTGNPEEELTLHTATLTITLWDTDAANLRVTSQAIISSRYSLMDIESVFGSTIANEYEDYDYDGGVFQRVILLRLLVEQY